MVTAEPMAIFLDKRVVLQLAIDATWEIQPIKSVEYDSFMLRQA